jgi:hypothetical protein
LARAPDLSSWPLAATPAAKPATAEAFLRNNLRGVDWVGGITFQQVYRKDTTATMLAYKASALFEAALLGLLPAAERYVSGHLGGGERRPSRLGVNDVAVGARRRATVLDYLVSIEVDPLAGFKWILRLNIAE